MKRQKGRGFAPNEIIFCPTSDCNLHCAHCFVTRKNNLNTEESIRFLENCIESSGKHPFTPIEKVGFSGGEPFLALDFLCEICKTAVENDLYFDNLMTNGVWWKTEDELKYALARLRDSGFDGKIGLSWDCFHGQPTSKIAAFINTAHQVFNDKTSVAIWSVVPKGNEKSDDKIAKGKIAELAKILGGKVDGKTDKKSGCGEIVILRDLEVAVGADTGSSGTPQNLNNFCTSDNSVASHTGSLGRAASATQTSNLYLPIYRFSESKMIEYTASQNNSASKTISHKTSLWTDKKWFTEDFCESTGQVLYVHANGKIAPCCGFANECEPLVIGTIKDSYETVMKNAAENKMVKICFEDGLSSCIKSAKKMLSVNGKTSDMCQFCAWVCGNIDNIG